MAKLVVVAVRDRAVDAFMNPFVCPSLGMAVRSFHDEVNNAESPMAKHPEDYELHQLGTFDQETGEVVMARRLVMVAKDTVKRSDTA